MTQPPADPGVAAVSARVHNFSASLEHEIFKSEKRRVEVMALVLTAMLIGILTIGQLLIDAVGQVMRARLSLALPLAVVVPALAFELWVRSLLVRAIARGTSIPLAIRLLWVFVELLVPTAILLVLCLVAHPAEALVAPPFMVYAALIALSVLSLDLRVCLAAGIFAAAQYLTLYWVFVYNGPPHSAFVLTAPMAAMARAFVMVLVGGLTGIAARELRRRCLDSLQALEEKRQVLDVFGQHVSPRVVDKLLQQHSTALSSETRNVCVMFLDIRNFTTFAEGRTPGQVVDFLNHLFSFMIEEVDRHDGIINKFLGDGFMAVFGAPLSDGKDCRNAVAASRAIVQRLHGEVAAGRLPVTRIGIGLHTGEAVTGQVGSVTRKEYTVIGDVVNLASRIESLSKAHDAQILVSDAVRDAAGHDLLADATDLGEVAVKGRAQPVRVYRVA